MTLFAVFLNLYTEVLAICSFGRLYAINIDVISLKILYVVLVCLQWLYVLIHFRNVYIHISHIAIQILNQYLGGVAFHHTGPSGKARQKMALSERKPEDFLLQNQCFGRHQS